jgi:hypothetical protein
LKSNCNALKAVDSQQEEKTMQSIELNNAAMPMGDSTDNVLRREVLKLSDLDAESVSDLSAMFGVWTEADHCDKAPS